MWLQPEKIKWFSHWSHIVGFVVFLAFTLGYGAVCIVGFVKGVYALGLDLGLGCWFLVPKMVEGFLGPGLHDLHGLGFCPVWSDLSDP